MNRFYGSVGINYFAVGKLAMVVEWERKNQPNNVCQQKLTYGLESNFLKIL